MLQLLFLIILLFPVGDQTTEGWKIHTIDASSSGADGVKLADINRDGLLDITTGWEEGGITKLYLHPGKDQVEELWPGVNVGKTPNVEDAVFADMNNDGRLDIVSCSESNTEKIFIQLSPENNLLDERAWSQHVLPASDRRMKWMYAEPLQLDGKNGVDLIAAGKGENSQVGWFEAPENGSDLDGWSWHPISPMGWVMSILLRDMDSDGDMDIVVTDRRLSMQACRWLENPGIGPNQKQPWQNHMIGGEKLEVMFMSMYDLDDNGKEEVIITERTNQTIRIFQRLNASGTSWSEKIVQIPVTTGSAKSVEVGDINQDGVADLVLSTNTNGKLLAGLTWIDGNDLNRTDNISFQAISGIHNAKYDKVELLDMDQDGDLDVLICEENYGENSQGLGVVWYENPTQ
jgi:hypothetical protein